MGNIPIWCLFKIHPHDAIKVGNAFDEAIRKSKVVYRLHEYLQERETNSSTCIKQYESFLCHNCLCFLVLGWGQEIKHQIIIDQLPVEHIEQGRS